MKIHSLLLMTTLFAAPAFAKDLTIDELRAIQSKVKGTEQLSVDFVQESFSKMRGKSVKRDGHALFQRPSKFKWMLEKPIQQSMIYDGKDFYEFNPESKSAMRYSPTGPRAYDLKQVVDLVLNFDSLLKRYDLVKAEQDGDNVKIRLKPKSEQDVTGVDLTLSVKDSLISYLKMTMKGGNYLAHDFKNPQRGALAADAFTLPKGVKVTDSN